MIIDSHQHVFWHGRNDAGLIRDMDDNGIDLAWLLTWNTHPTEDNHSYHSVLNPAHLRPDGTHPGIPLQDLIVAKEHYPDRFVLGYCPHPLLGDAVSLFEAAYYTHGVRICGEWKFRLLFDDPRCLNLFRKAGELKCPVVLHLDVPYLPDQSGTAAYQPLWFGGTVANLERALATCPETNFIGHAPGFWREISGNADTSPDMYPTGSVTPNGHLYRLFDTYPNLFADLSASSGLGALRRDTQHAILFINRYADRLLFGRDYYGGNLQEFLDTLGLEEDILNQIYCNNALRLVPGTN